MEDQQNLFKLFGFIDTTKEINTRGIGLGLHISQQIANNFGGTITCHSKYQKGSTFTFSFNLEDSDLVDESALQLRIKNPNPKGMYSKFRATPEQPRQLIQSYSKLLRDRDNSYNDGELSTTPRKRILVVDDEIFN